MRKVDHEYRKRQNDSRSSAYHNKKHSKYETMNRCFPENMPSDEYLNSYESNPFAAEAAFMSMTRNWELESYRDIDLKSLDEMERQELQSYMKNLAEPDDKDIEKCFKDFTDFINPCQPAVITH